MYGGGNAGKYQHGQMQKDQSSVATFCMDAPGAACACVCVHVRA